ncbi:unnamed protein product, partial [Staurois parvus]
VLNNFGLKPGHCVEVEGFIPEGFKQFSIDLGTDAKNLVLHFNPRFDALGDKHKIILNSMVDNVWGAEHRKSFFPSRRGQTPWYIYTGRGRTNVGYGKVASLYILDT